MAAYYNEFDEKAAAWLRELIRRGLIVPGDVDTRSILDVRPDDLKGYTQCHFFAGVGVWSYALRRAGWSDDRPVWTGSCPCQPFSAAGKGGGFDDERHLWPAFFHLIAQCRPDIVFGEQVASKDGLGWLDLVCTDLEGSDYAVGAVDTCAAGFGAPHIRQRLYWVADAAEPGRQPRWRFSIESDGGRPSWVESGRLRDAGGLADTDGGHASEERQQRGGEQRQQPQDGGAVRVADTPGPRHEQAREHERGQSQLPPRPAEHGGVVRPAGPTNGLWRDADWLYCRDGKWRPVEPGTFPLAHGAPARVGRLRGYGNAINAEQAEAFIEAYLDSRTIEAVAQRNAVLTV